MPRRLGHAPAGRILATATNLELCEARFLNRQSIAFSKKKLMHAGRRVQSTYFTARTSADSRAVRSLEDILDAEALLPKLGLLLLDRIHCQVALV